MSRGEANGCGLCPPAEGPPAEIVGAAVDVGGWQAGVLRGYEVPGWIAVFPRRHVESFDALDEAEADALGGSLRRAATAIRAGTCCAKVYAVSFGERIPHVHVLLMAVPADLADAHRGAALLAQRGRLRDPAAARAVAALLSR